MKGNEGRRINLDALKLSPVEEAEKFFYDGIIEIEVIHVAKQVKSLVQVKTVGVWNIEHCLNCSINCYAISKGRSTALASTNLVSSLDAINQMKNHKDYSPLFRIIIKPLYEELGSRNVATKHSPQRMQAALSGLQQQLGEAVQEEVIKAEERIRAFSKKTYDDLEEFRNRANRDHKALVRTLYEIQHPPEQDPRPPAPEELSNFPMPPETQVPPIDRRIIVRSKTQVMPSTTSLELGGKKSRLLTNRTLSLYTPRQNSCSTSIDSETLFVIEGMEDTTSNEPCPSEGDSDTDHDDSGSHDEGIDVHRKRANSIQMAKSLPVNVPVYSVANTSIEQDEECDDPVDIAASIKALAQSVHGDAVFGELPRPRFSTQI